MAMMDDESTLPCESSKKHPINEDIDETIPEVDKVWPEDDQVLRHQLDDNDDLQLDLGDDLDLGLDLGMSGPGYPSRSFMSPPRMIRRPIPGSSASRAAAAAFGDDARNPTMDDGYHDSHFNERKGEYTKPARNQYLSAPSKAERQSNASGNKRGGSGPTFRNENLRPLDPGSKSASTAFDEVDALIMKYTNVNGEELSESRLGGNEGEE